MSASTSEPLWRLRAAEAAAAIRDRALSPVELTEAVLDRIADVDGTLRSYVVVAAEQALDEARQREREAIDDGIRGPLHGVPVAIKDVFDVAGLPTRGGSRSTSPVPLERDAEAVRRLRRAGAIVIGKTVTHELAYGSMSPPTANPWDLERIPGGSSGGSAAAVAAGLAPVAIGTDCSGSVRIPASLCGVLGFKPTYGLVSRAGAIPLSWSLDHVGVLAQDPADAALVLSAMSGPDDGDEAGISPGRWREFALPDPAGWRDDAVSGLRVGVPGGYFAEHISAAVRAGVEQALRRLEDLGAQLVPLDVSFLDPAMDVQYGIVRPEAAAYHAPRLHAHPERFGPRVRQLLEVGAGMPATAYVDAHRMRAVIRRRFAACFREVDVLAAPTSPTVAARIGSDTVDVDGRTEPVSPAFVRLCVPASLGGLPAASVPCGMHEGLPFGLQLIARPHADDQLLQLAATFLASAGSRPVPPVDLRGEA